MVKWVNVRYIVMQKLWNHFHSNCLDLRQWVSDYSLVSNFKNSLLVLLLKVKTWYCSAVCWSICKYINMSYCCEEETVQNHTDEQDCRLHGEKDLLSNLRWYLQVFQTKSVECLIAIWRQLHARLVLYGLEDYTNLQLFPIEFVTIQI